MRLIINGQNKEVSNANTIEDVINQFSKNKSHLIAELNGTIIATGDWNSTSLKEGDALELVAFVGGG